MKRLTSFALTLGISSLSIAAPNPVKFQSPQGSIVVVIKEVDRTHDNQPEAESPTDRITYVVEFLNKEGKVIRSSKFVAEDDVNFQPQMVFKEIIWSPSEELAVFPQSKGGWGYSPHVVLNLSPKFDWEKTEMNTPHFGPVWNGDSEFYFIGESEDFCPSIMKFDAKVNTVGLLKKGDRHFHYYLVKLNGEELLTKKVPFDGDVEDPGSTPLCASFNIQSNELKDISCPNF